MTQEEKFEKELKKALSASVKNTASNLNYLLEAAYELAIYSFYMDYQPKYYRRTLKTYEGSSLYNSPEIENPLSINNGYRAQIGISETNISGNPYRADKEWVFRRTFNEGIHGVSSYEAKYWGQNKYWHRKNVLRKGHRQAMINRYYKGQKHSFDQWMKILLHNRGYIANQYKQYRIPIARTKLSAGEKYTMYMYDSSKLNSGWSGVSDNMLDASKYYTLQDRTLKRKMNTNPYDIFKREFRDLSSNKKVQGLIYQYFINELMKG